MSERQLDYVEVRPVHQTVEVTRYAATAPINRMIDLPGEFDVVTKDNRFEIVTDEVTAKPVFGGETVELSPTTHREGEGDYGSVEALPVGFSEIVPDSASSPVNSGARPRTPRLAQRVQTSKAKAHRASKQGHAFFKRNRH